MDLPTFCLIAAVAVLSGIGLVLGWRIAQTVGLLLSAGGVLGGLVILFAFVPILDVVEGGCGWVLTRALWWRASPTR